MPSRKRSLSKAALVWGIVGMATLFVIGTLALVRHLDRTRIVAYADAPDGSAFCVVQRCNWSFEFFTTGCYYRKPGGRWYWFYYDHEDTYWGRGRTEIVTFWLTIEPSRSRSEGFEMSQTPRDNASAPARAERSEAV